MPLYITRMQKMFKYFNSLAIDRPNAIERNYLAVRVIMSDVIDNGELAFHHLEACWPPAIRLGIRCSRQHLHSMLWVSIRLQYKYNILYSKHYQEMFSPVPTPTTRQLEFRRKQENITGSGIVKMCCLSFKVFNGVIHD